MLIDFTRVAVTGVDAGNLKSVLSALASAPVTAAAVDTRAELQALVDAYIRIRTEANGSAADTDPTRNPSAADYRAIGVELTARQADHIGLLNETIDQQSVAGVDAVSKLQALADAMGRVLDTTGDTPATLADYAALGLGGVTQANLEIVNFEIATLLSEQAGPVSRDELQSIIDNAGKRAWSNPIWWDELG